MVWVLFIYNTGCSLIAETCFQDLVEGAILCFRNPYFYFRHGESTSTVCQLTSPASQKSKDLNKASLLLQDLVFSTEQSFAPCTCYYLTRIKEGYFDRTQKNIASLCFTLESKLWLQNFSYQLNKVKLKLLTLFWTGLKIYVKWLGGGVRHPPPF